MREANATWLEEASWLAFEKRAGETLRDALARTIRDAIREGVLRPGTSLPASRVLARELRVSRGVVSDAYAQLEAQGCVVSRPRVAPEVAALPKPTGASRAGRAAPLATPRFDFTPTTPDVTLFPTRDWVRAYSDATRRSPTSALDYRDPQGEAELRNVLADHLGRTRGAIVDPDLLVVVRGTAQAVDLLLRACRELDWRRFAVENPSHTTQHARIRSAGLELVPVAVDGHGVTIPQVDADAALVTPAHQFPTGTIMSGDRRRRLIDWAIGCGAVVVEDDYDSEFRYDGEPVRALQGLAAGQVVLIGTVSKTLAPALRLGWIVAPERLVELLVTAKRLADDFTSSLDQLALAGLMRSGAYDRHIRKTRAAYRRRRDRLLRALEKEMPEVEVEGVAAGVHLVLRLDHDVDDKAIAHAAERRRVRIEPLSRFYLDGRSERGLVLGYGRVHESAIPDAARELARVVRSHSAAA